MLDDIRRRQMLYVPLLLISCSVAGAAAAFVWEGWAFPWWYRALAVLVVLGCLVAAYQAIVQLREALQELRALRKFARANRRGPQAAPLQTARRDDDDGMGGFDMFEGRRGA